MAPLKEDDRFPPRPDHEHEWEAHERILASVCNGRTADYVVTPITSGKRFLEWNESEGRALESNPAVWSASREAHVVGPNTLRARRFVERLRAERRIVIEPTSLHLPHWTQNDYRHLWGRIIQRYVRRVWLLDDWQYSNGCCYEFYEAMRFGVEAVSEAGDFIDRGTGTLMIETAMAEIERFGHKSSFLRKVVMHLDEVRVGPSALYFKDEALDQLAGSANVAQFVSFGPGRDTQQRVCHVIGVPPNFAFPAIEDAIAAILKASPEGMVNVRSFKPEDPENHPFQMGLTTIAEVVARVRALADQGLWTIVNETINVHDGGVSGVLADGIVEFSPGDTPRCVEHPGTARLPAADAEHLLETVYGFRPALNYDRDLRVEFSIHPLCRGLRNEHTVVWEAREQPRPREALSSQTFGKWPNNFSRFLGDKVYGLLIADALGVPVPRTSVTPRHVAPFHFGRATRSSEYWLRTSPSEKEPGRYPTRRGWQDPFLLMQEFDESGEKLPSVMAQEGVRSTWSGALITGEDDVKIEGVYGFGDLFMQGRLPPMDLPAAVVRSVRQVYDHLSRRIGPVTFEWAFDGDTAWILQLHQEETLVKGDTIVSGNPAVWYTFPVSNGLESLRIFLSSVSKRSDIGIILSGRVGLTSHFSDLVRKANIPARIEDDDATLS